LQLGRQIPAFPSRIDGFAHGEHQLRAQAAEKLAEAAELETKAETLEARATEISDKATGKRDLAARRIASAEKKEAKAQKRPAQADRLLAQAADLRAQAAELSGKADKLQARADWRNNRAAELRATASTLRDEAAELNAAADAMEQPPEEVDDAGTLWTTTLTVGVLNADFATKRLGFQNAYSYEHGELSNKTVVNGEESYAISGLTWSYLRREVWILAHPDSWEGLADHFDDKWLSCTRDGATVVSGQLEARHIKAREGMKLHVQSAPWAEGDTVDCRVLLADPSPPTTTTPPTPTIPEPPSRIWSATMDVGATWNGRHIGFNYHDVLGYGWLSDTWITVGDTRYQIGVLEWNEDAEAVHFVAAYPASEVLDGSWLSCTDDGTSVLAGELDDNGFGTLVIDGHSASPWAEDDRVACEIWTSEPPSS